MTNVIITSASQLKSVFLALMISDASEAATKLNLAEQLPIQGTNLTLAHVHPPMVIPYLGLGGVIDTVNWSYSYHEAGKLAFVVRMKPNFWTRNNMAEYRKFAVPPSEIDTNSAPKIAVRWLEKLGVDTRRLEEECRVEVRHKRLKDLTIPEYRVVWWRDTNDVASVMFLQPGEQLLQLRVEDRSFLLRPSITNGLTLNIPEEEP
jgi:hypothetical protein